MHHGWKLAYRITCHSCSRDRTEFEYHVTWVLLCIAKFRVLPTVPRFRTYCTFGGGYSIGDPLVLPMFWCTLYWKSAALSDRLWPRGLESIVSNSWAAESDPRVMELTLYLNISLLSRLQPPLQWSQSTQNLLQHGLRSFFALFHQTKMPSFIYGKRTKELVDPLTYARLSFSVYWNWKRTLEKAREKVKMGAQMEGRTDPFGSRHALPNDCR